MNECMSLCDSVCHCMSYKLVSRWNYFTVFFIDFCNIAAKMIQMCLGEKITKIYGNTSQKPSLINSKCIVS